MRVVNNHLERLPLVNHRHAPLYRRKTFRKNGKLFQIPAGNAVHGNHGSHDIVGVERARQLRLYVHHTVLVCKRLVVFKAVNRKAKPKARRRNVTSRKIRHVVRNLGQGLCAQLLAGLLARLAFRSKADYLLFCGRAKVRGRRIFQIHHAEGRNLPKLSADVLFVTVFVKRAEKVRLVAPVLLVGSVEFQVLKRYVHEQAAVKLHVAQAVSPLAQTVRRRLHNRVLAAVLQHLIQLALHNRRFGRGLVLRVCNRIAAERILHRRNKACLVAAQAQKLPDERHRRRLALSASHAEHHKTGGRIVVKGGGKRRHGKAR